MTIELYSNGPACQGCRATERYLDRRGLVRDRDYVIHRLDQGATLPKHIEAHTAPVVVYADGKYHSGFRPDLLNRLIPVEEEVLTIA